MNQSQQLRFIRKPEVLNLLAVSKTTLQTMVNDGLVPPPIHLGERAVAHINIEVNQVLAAMAAGKTQEQIKELVEYLVDNRHRYAEALEVM